MTGFLPEIVLPLEASISDLIAKLTEANVAIRAWADGLPNETRSVAPTMEREGEKVGQGLRRGAEKGAKGDGTSILSKLLGGTTGALFNPVTLIGGLVGGLGPLASTLAQTVGAIGLIPAAASAAIESLAVLKIGLHGVGTALGAGLTGNATAYAAAMAKLVPAQQAFVKELVATKPALDAIRQTVATNLFAGMDTQIKGLASTYLPLLRKELGGVAAGFNSAFRQVFDLVRVPDYINSVRESLANMRLGLVNASGSLAAIVSGLNDLVNVGSRFLPGLGAGFAGLADRFSAFMGQVAGDGRLQQWIQTGLDAIKTILPVIKDLGSLVMELLGAMAGAGGGAIGIIAQLVHQLVAFFKTAQGAQALATVFQILGVVAGVLGDVITAALPLIAQLLPIVMTLVTALRPLVSSVLTALATVLGAVASALGPIVNALMPILNLLVQHLMFSLQLGTPVLVQLAETLGTVLTQAITALLPAFVRLLPVFEQLATQLAPQMIPLIVELGQVLLDLLPALVPLIKLLLDLLVPTLHVLIPIQLKLIEGFVAAIVVIEKVVAPVAKFVGWLIKLIDSAKTWKAVGKWFTDVWHDITKAFDAGLKWIEAFPGKVWAALQALPGILLDAADRGLHQMAFAIGYGLGEILKEMMAFPGQVWAIITDLWTTAGRLFSQGIDVVLGWVSKLSGRIWSLFTQTKDTAVSTTSNMIDTVVSYVSKLPGRVRDWLKTLPKVAGDAVADAGNWLYDAGKHLIEGLLRGIKDAAGSVVSYVGGLGKSLFSGFMNAIQGHSPSRLFAKGGDSIVSGLLGSILAGARPVGDAVKSLIGTPRSVLDLSAIGAPGGGPVPIAAAGGAPGPQQQERAYAPIVIQLGGKELAVVHAALIPTAQRYKLRAGTTGLT